MEAWRPLAPPQERMRRHGEGGVLGTTPLAVEAAVQVEPTVLGFAVPPLSCFFPSAPTDVHAAAGGGVAHLALRVLPARSRDERQRGVSFTVEDASGVPLAAMREEFSHCARTWWVLDAGGGALGEQRALLLPGPPLCCAPRCFAAGCGLCGCAARGNVHALRGPPFLAPRCAALPGARRAGLTAGERAARQGALRAGERKAAEEARAGLWDVSAPDASWRGRPCCLSGGELRFGNNGERRMATLRPAWGACDGCTAQSVAYRLEVEPGADEVMAVRLVTATLHIIHNAQTLKADGNASRSRRNSHVVPPCAFTQLAMALALLRQEHWACGLEGLANFEGHGGMYGLR